MAITHARVQYGPEGYTGLLCHPEGAALPLPAIVVLPEIWGLNDHIEDVTHRFAAAGYAALAPDLYAVGGKRPPAKTRERIAELQAFISELPPGSVANPEVQAQELARRPEAERDRLQETRAELFRGFGAGPSWLEPFRPQLQATSRFLRTECSLSQGQKVGAVGFCMGGGLTALLACDDPELEGAVIFYGSAPPLDRVTNIRCPVLGHYAELDAQINAGLPAFAAAMASEGKAFESHLYPGAHHGFFRDGSPVYNVRASREAFVRTLAFFRERLS